MIDTKLIPMSAITMSSLGPVFAIMLPLKNESKQMILDNSYYTESLGYPSIWIE